MRGTIRSIKADRGFAFIRGEDSRDYFFHRKTNTSLFDELLVNDVVRFEGGETERGYRASHVERA